ncbi:MAG: ABC transporter substrate-binding protein [Alicyclobacillus sp.]|nr:ABC transporter substrate-binding protein [Alicyclobacillus sp.]
MYPERIVCLAAEIPEILHRLGALDRVVGISAYTTRPVEALSIRKVSGFQHGSVKRILEVRPDVVILTSSVQQKLAAELTAEGVPILHFNPHRLEDMFRTILLLGNVVGQYEQAVTYVAELREQVEEIRQSAEALPWHPRVYFEEWMEPIIAGTAWVSDLMEIAGGRDVFRERSIGGRRASRRVVEAADVVAAAPDVVFASWCGKPFNQAAFLARPGFADLPAARNGHVVELSGEVLQCGPMLVDSLREMHEQVRRVVAQARVDH